jgi:hypothetical protein
VRDQVSSWMKLHQLSRVKMEERPGNLLMHVTKRPLNGFFEFTYRVDLAVQQAFKKYDKGKGIANDDLLSWFPPGVETAWSRWSPASFTCNAPSQ